MTVSRLEKISNIIPYIGNAKKHPDEQILLLAASIKEFGACAPILIDKDNGIIAGHGRYLAALRLGLEQFPVVILDHLTETQKKAYILADNRLGEVGGTGWDMELVSLELESLDEDDFNIELTGFDDSFLIGKDVEGLTDDDEVPDAPDNPVTVTGDLWLLGDHRLLCGDSTQLGDVERLMGGGKADMVFTDPPYNADYSSIVDNKRRKPWGGILNDKMSDDAFGDFLVDLNSTLWSVMKESASVYECIDWKHYTQMEKVFGDAFTQKSTIIWDKCSFGLGTYYRTQYEMILFGVRGEKVGTWKSGYNETNVWKVKRAKDYVHPTQKPVELVSRAIKNSSNSGDVVLDLFGGSGTTMIAAERNARRSRLMELDPKYCDVIIKRWQDFTGLQATSQDGRVFNGIEGDNG